MTETAELPAPVTNTIWLALDEEGTGVVTTDTDDLTDIACDLVPGYRLIKIVVTARPPVDTVVEVDVPDIPHSTVTATATG